MAFLVVGQVFAFLQALEFLLVVAFVEPVLLVALVGLEGSA